jgi:hypothetical protein
VVQHVLVVKKLLVMSVHQTYWVFINSILISPVWLTRMEYSVAWTAIWRPIKHVSHYNGKFAINLGKYLVLQVYLCQGMISCNCWQSCWLFMAVRPMDKCCPGWCITSPRFKQTRNKKIFTLDTKHKYSQGVLFNSHTQLIFEPEWWHAPCR